MLIKDPKWRMYIYGILVAAGGIALVYGLLAEDEVAAWLALGASILGNGLAFANTPASESGEK